MIVVNKFLEWWLLIYLVLNVNVWIKENYPQLFLASFSSFADLELVFILKYLSTLGWLDTKLPQIWVYDPEQDEASEVSRRWMSECTYNFEVLFIWVIFFFWIV